MNNSFNDSVKKTGCQVRKNRKTIKTIFYTSACAASFSLLSSTGYAQEISQNQMPKIADSVTYTAAPKACEKYDFLRAHGSESPVITVCDTLSPSQFGLRDFLGKRGFMFEGNYSAGEIYDVLGHRGRPQRYNGQNPNFSGALWLNLNYDLTRLGFGKDSVFSISGNNWQNAYPGAGLRGTKMSQLTAYLTFFDQHLTAQFGFYSMLGQFYGQTIGTSSASSALGPQSVIPNLVGMSLFAPTPGIDIRYYFPDRRFYNHVGVSRSQSPDGFQADARANHMGLTFAVDGAKPIVVDEIGYRVNSSATTKKFWVRAGGIYNSSKYYNYGEGRKTYGNSAFYVIGDFQFTKPNPTNPSNGLYLELKTDHAATQQNVFTDDYSTTIYSIGPLASRPLDMLSLGFTYSKIGGAFQVAKQPASHRFNNSTTSSLAYAAHVVRGIYFVGTTSYTTHPVTEEYFKSAFTLQGQFTFSF